MPPSESDPIAPSDAAQGWLGRATRHAHSIRRLIGQGVNANGGQDWTSSKSRRPARRPVWE